jgi:hypothetical protein
MPPTGGRLMCLDLRLARETLMVKDIRLQWRILRRVANRDGVFAGKGSDA